MKLITIAQDSTYPSLTDTITVNDRPMDLSAPAVTGVKFMMREAQSSTTKISANANIEDAATGQVSYDWAPADTNTEGDYRGWWRVIFMGTNRWQDSPEFQVIVDAHAPGFGVLTGAIARRVRQEIPIGYAALAAVPDYGESMLQDRVGTAKFRLFGTVCMAAAEATLYNPLVLDYAAKVAAIQIIPAVADYWSNQITQETTTGTNEVVTFPDRMKGIWDLHKRLVAEVDQMRPEVETFIQLNPFRRGRFPLVDTQAAKLTPDPQRFPDQSGFRPRNLPWSPFRNVW